MPRARGRPRRSSNPPPWTNPGVMIDQSNETLNMFLGGRQKSWMTGDGGAVMPPPSCPSRPPPTNTTGQAEGAHINGNIGTGRSSERSSVSTSASPHSASAHAPLQQPAAATDSAVSTAVPASNSSIPSPPLSPESIQAGEDKDDTAAANTDPGPPTSWSCTTVQPSTIQPAAGVLKVSYPVEVVKEAEPHQRAREPRDVGSGKRLVVHADHAMPKRMRIDPPPPPTDAALQAGCPQSAAAIPSQFTPVETQAAYRPGGNGGRNERPVHTQAPLRHPAQPIAPVNVGAGTQQYVQFGQRPIMPNAARASPTMVIPQPPTPTLASHPPLSNAPGPRFAAQSQDNPQVPPDWVPPLVQLSEHEQIVAIQRMQSFLQLAGGYGRFNKLSQLRLDIIEQAVKQRDAFYLLFHQILCLHKKSPETVPRMFSTIPGFEAAMNTLDQDLGGTLGMTLNLLGFLSGFPFNLEAYPWENPTIFARLVEDFGVLVRRTQARRPVINAYAIEKGLLPLATDLLNSLGIPSRLLMTVVFRALLRKAWILHASNHQVATDIEQLAVAIHESDSRDLWTAIAEGRQQAPSWSQWVSNQYEQLRSHLLGHRMAQSQSPISGQHVTQPVVQMNRRILPAQQAPETRPPPPAGFFTSPSTRSGVIHQTRGQENPIQSTQQSSHVRREHSGSTPVSLPTGAPGQPNLCRLGANAATGSQQVDRQPNITQAQQRPTVSQTPPQQHPGVPPQVLNPTFFPALSEVLQYPAMARPTSALHQSHLRSPRLLSQQEPLDTPTRLYQSLENFALPPSRLPSSEPCLDLSFNISEDDFKLVPHTLQMVDGERPRRIVSPGSRQYRLRMCKLQKLDCEESKLSAGQWGLIETSWAPQIFISFNGHAVELRRKSHFAKDLPSDVTTLIISGKNQVAVRINAAPKDLPVYAAYAIAVEVVTVRSSSQIQAEVAGRVIPAAATVEKIRQRLAPSDADSDDEVMIVNEHLTIQLFEPFSYQQIFTVPVRGADCTHFDCFDFDIWLQSRPAKKPVADARAPSTIDDWRCPICRGDARPQALVIDGFLVQVRKTLEEKDLLGTRQIVVSPNGTWEPKAEKTVETVQQQTPTVPKTLRNGTPTQSPTNQHPAASTVQPADVVEILDDDQDEGND